MTDPRPALPTPPDTTLDRRRLLGFAGAGTAAVLLGTGAWTAGGAYAAPRSDNPFTLGVASGDPFSRGFVLWTRLAPEPLDPDGRGGMPSRPVRVSYQVAADERFRRVVRDGSVLAGPRLAHAVHPEISGLEPDRPYWYRFRAGTHLSPVGRTRTAPLPSARVRALSFAFASCQAWQDGFYTAYDHLAEEDLDLVLHLGDYLYEYGVRRNRRGVSLPAEFGTETYDLARYRLQYALYKSDRSLQRAHAAAPWVQTIDDHEVENNWAGAISQRNAEPDQDRALFLRRRARAFQAMYEHLPLRRAQTPAGPDARLHRRLRYGTLVDFTLLDTRQYRSDQPCGDGFSASCEQRFDPDQTMLGGRQKRWLLDGFTRSPARWQVIGNQAPMGQTDFAAARRRVEVALDPWDGYVRERNEILAQARDRDVRNLVVVTGDRHTNYAADLLGDYQRRRSPVVGTELVGTSISSGGDGADIDDAGRVLLAANPHLRFYNNQRGYVRVRVTPERMTADFRVVDRVTRPGAKVRTRARFVVEDGRPGPQRDR